MGVPFVYVGKLVRFNLEEVMEWARRCASEEDEFAQRPDRRRQRHRLQGVLAQERLPLLCLLLVQAELIGEAQRRAGRDGSSPALERGANCRGQHRAVEVGMSGENPEVEVVLHPAAEHAELDHRFQLFGDYGVAGIDPQLRLGHAVEDDRVLHVVRAGRHGVAEADVDLHRAARAIEQADHRHADARVVGLLADFGGLHAVGLKDDAVIAGDLADLAE